MPKNLGQLFLSMETYDFVFVGAGCAGLSMIHYLLKSKMKNAKILILEPNPEIPNKTWCYWSEVPFDIHPPENIISWDSFNFISKDKKLKKSLGKLKYYYLKSSDFFSSILNEISKAKNITKLEEKVNQIKSEGLYNKVETSSGNQFLAKTIFDSRIEEPLSPTILKQVFLGWKIKTTNSCFDTDGVTLMNFIESKNKFDFFYILPFSETEALVEYTAYSKESINYDILETKLSEYLKSNFQISSYEISYSEFGSIPMTTTLSQKQINPSIIKIGTGAGWIKASTGYGFSSIQKKCKSIIDQLEKGKMIQISRSTRFDFYDNILLNIAHKWPQKLQSIFMNLFETSSAQDVLQFLSEETTIKEEIQILQKVKFRPFIKSLLNYERH